MTEITNTAAITNAATDTELAELAAVERASVVENIDNALSDNTKLAYSQRWRAFVAWCVKRRLSAENASPETVATHLSWLAKQKKKGKPTAWATINLTRSAITKAFRIRDLPSPAHSNLVEMACRGIRREIGTAQKGMDALTPAQIAKLIRVCNEPDESKKGADIRAVRDRAILLVGFATGMRISNLAALTVGDVKMVDAGCIITLKRSKTDQDAKGFEIAVPFEKNVAFCAVRALEFWLNLSVPNAKLRAFDGPATDAPLFCATNSKDVVFLNQSLSVERVRQMLNERLKQASIEGHYSGHTFRVTMITIAAARGKNLHKIMGQSGHKTPAMVLRYIREADRWIDNPVAGVFDEVE